MVRHIQPVLTIPKHKHVPYSCRVWGEPFFQFTPSLTRPLEPQCYPRPHFFLSFSEKQFLGYI